MLISKYLYLSDSCINWGILRKKFKYKSLYAKALNNIYVYVYIYIYIYIYIHSIFRTCTGIINDTKK